MPRFRVNYSEHINSEIFVDAKDEQSAMELVIDGGEDINGKDIDMGDAKELDRTLIVNNIREQV